MMAACTPSAIDEMKGVYSAPVDAQISKLDGEMAIDKREGFRFITVKLSGSDQLVVKFASKDYFLTPTTYYINSEAGIKAGMYSAEGSSFNGQAITFGSINVESEDNFNYTISGVIEIGENVRERFSWTGELYFEADPEPVKLSNVLSAQSNVASGTMSVTMNLATASVSSSFDPATYQTTYTGEGYYAAIDIYSADGYLHEGTYKPCAAGGVIGEGEYGIGWDPGDLWGIGMVFENWGTCWWTVDNGTTSAEKINAGDIVVTKKGSKFVIEYNNYDGNGIWFVFEGAIEALTEPSDVPPTIYKMIDNPGQVTDEQNTPVDGFDRHDIQLLAADGETLVAGFDLVVKAGSDIAGTYTVKGYPHEDHIAGNGWGIPDWNYYGGTRFVDETGVLVYVNPESVLTVTKNADGTYTFSASNAKLAASTGGEEYTGDFEYIGTFGDVPGPGADVVALTKVLSYQNNNANGTKSVTVNLASADVESSFDPATYQTVYTGTGFYAAIDFYSEDGTIAEGTYVPCATAGSIAAGEYGIGWDPGDLWGIGMIFENWGTCWWAVNDGVTSATKITDGNITVSKSGADYVIEYNANGIAFKYEGPIGE